MASQPQLRDERSRILRCLLEDFAGRLSGSVLLARRGQVLLRSALDPRRPTSKVDTPYLLAGLSKPLLALATANALHEFRLDLDVSCAEVIPDFPWDPRITVRHLLSESSGIPNCTENPELRERLARCANLAATYAELRTIPWQPADYGRHVPNSTNFFMAGILLEKLTGLPLAAALRQHLSKPLSLKRTHFSWERLKPPSAQTWFSSEAALVSNVDDLWTFIQAISTRSGVPEVVLNDLWGERNRTVQAAARTRYSCGFHFEKIGSQVCWSHTGTMPATHLAFYPDSEVTTIVLSDGEDGAIHELASRLTETALNF